MDVVNLPRKDRACTGACSGRPLPGSKQASGCVGHPGTSSPAPQRVRPAAVPPNVSTTLPPPDSSLGPRPTPSHAAPHL